MNYEYVIVVAGGKGLRMGADLPKQFLPINGKAVLMHTIERFRDYSEALEIILVLPHEQQDFWHALCEKHHFNIPHTIVDGGETRFHSSQNGLAAIPDDAQGVVGIHDGVRPFVSSSRLTSATRPSSYSQYTIRLCLSSIVVALVRVGVMVG